ncbi:MAG TPA: hypothetical protein VGV89_01140 [Thermoplasmata archaeon]|nr:hypothetical protein [Thermoplasmata archaeon]
MAKRRFKSSPDEETDEGPATSSEDRRRERKRQRTAREAGNVRAGSRSNLLRRGLIFGVPIAVIIGIIVLLLVNPFQGPCLQLQAIPSQSGLPAFPSHNASTDLTTSWCPPSVTSVMQVFPYLRIRIGGTDVGIPTSIGRNANYTYQGQPYTCTLPMSTNTGAYDEANGLQPGSILITSAWPYVYTLGDFFEVWGQSYSTVDVNASYTAQPITYTSSDLLGFTPDATHSIQLFVDNQVSTAGPDLNLDTYSNNGQVYPSCMGRIYGTGHTVYLTYASSLSAQVTPLRGASGLATSVSGGALAELAWDSPAPHLITLVYEFTSFGHLREQSLNWLLLRGGH